jgi:hypothetical protein
MSLKSFKQWSRLYREDETAGDPKELLQRVQTAYGKAQDDEVKSVLNDVLTYLQQQTGGDENGPQDGDSDQATDGASNSAGTGGGGMNGMQMPAQAGGGTQNATM